MYKILLYLLASLPARADEIQCLDCVDELIRNFNVKADYFMVTQVSLGHRVEGLPFDRDGKLDFSKMKGYFVIEPIEICTDTTA